MSVEYLESPSRDDIIHGQALLRLTGAGGLELSGELDVPTVIALARSLGQKPQVPKLPPAHNNEFSTGFARDFQRKGLLIAPEAKNMSVFLADAANRASYPKLAREALDAYQPRMEMLAERVGVSPDDLP